MARPTGRRNEHRRDERFSSRARRAGQRRAAACERVIHSGWWILGREVTAFEQAWAAYLGAPAAVGCANGLDAIELGLLSRVGHRPRGRGHYDSDDGVRHGSRSAARRRSARAGGHRSRHCNAVRRECARRCIGPHTRAVLLVHLYGQAYPPDELLDVARDRGVHLLEDCAQAHGAMWGGRSVGNFGAFAAWSFYPTKNLGLIGDGGALTTSRPEVAEKVRVLRNYGQTVRYQHPFLGMNSRADELQAAILSARLQYVTQWVARRRAIATRYAAEINNRQIRVLPLPQDPLRHSHHLFVVTPPRRRELQAHLRDREVESLIHYPIPIHMQEPCR